MGQKILNRNRSHIDSWDEAIPLGNGNLGGLLYGNKEKIRLALSSSLLWDLRKSADVDSPDFSINEFLHLKNGGQKKNQELQEKYGGFYDRYPYPTPIPVGALEFYPENTDSVFIFDMDAATGTVKLDFGEVKVFFSAHRNVVYIEAPAQLRCGFVFPDFSPEIKNENQVGQSLSRLEYGDHKTIRIGLTHIYEQELYNDNKYIVVTSERINGSVREIVASVKLIHGEYDTDGLIDEITSALQSGFENELTIHINDWNKYYNASGIHLPKSEKHLQEQYVFAQYLLKSGSRSGYPPMALQGVWIADNGCLPPWKGDYHTDFNLEMTYNFAFAAGRFEELKPFIEYFVGNKQNFNHFAESFFGIKDGFFIPGTLDLKGNIMGGWVQYTYSIGNTLWIISMLDKWYEYFRDEKYLREFLLPVLTETYRVLTKIFLCQKGDKYELVMSVSPEINDASYDAWVQNSSFDLFFIHCFLQTYIKRSSNTADVSEAKTILEHLAEVSLGKNGVMLAEGSELKESHRHFSHCVNIFPLHTMEATDKTELSVADKTLEHIKSLGSKMWVGFSFVWMAALYAAVMRGNEAAEQLKIFQKAFVSENGFHLNGDYKRLGYSSFKYRPFTAEGNFLFADAMQEMCMQYYNDILRLFPAIPEDWARDGLAFHGFRINKDVIVSASIAGDEINCEIECKNISSILIYCFNQVYKKDLIKGKNKFRFIR